MKKYVKINVYNFPKKFHKILLKCARNTLVVKKGILTGEISLILISDINIRKLNKKFRNVDRITDVISFLYSSKSKNGLYGDIYIARQRSKHQAKQQKHSWEKELSYLVIHGVLHLLGYTDYTKKNRNRMFSIQDKIWKHLFFSVQ